MISLVTQMKNNQNKNQNNNIKGTDKNDLSKQLEKYKNTAEQAIDLIFNNKINAKNAFDINNEFLEKIHFFLEKNEEDSWQKVSASLDASAKIYAFRVDSVLSETYRFLGGLSRNEFRNYNLINDYYKDLDENDDQEDRNISLKLSNKSRNNLTLEIDPRKLECKRTEFEYDVDPMFKNMTAKFNDSGAKGLLLKSLPLDKDSDILLEMKSSAVDIKRNNGTQIRSLNKTKYSDDLSDTTYNVNSLYENNLRSITTKCSSITNSEKSLPKCNFYDASIDTIIKGTLLKNFSKDIEVSSLKTESEKGIEEEFINFVKSPSEAEKYAICRGLEYFRNKLSIHSENLLSNTSNIQTKLLNNSLRKEDKTSNEELYKIRESLIEEDENNYSINKDELENITVTPLMINISDSDNEVYQTHNQDSQNKTLKSTHPIDKKLFTNKQFFEELNLASEDIQNLNLNEDIEMKEVNLLREANLDESKNELNNLNSTKNNIFESIQNLGKGLRPNSDENIKNILKSMNNNETNNITLLRNKRLLKNKDIKKPKNMNSIHFCEENEVEENEFFYKETRKIKNQLRKNKMKANINAEQMEKIIEENYDICEGQLNMNKKFKKSHNKIKHLFHYNTEQMFHNSFMHCELDKNFISAYIEAKPEQIDDSSSVHRGEKVESHMNQITNDHELEVDQIEDFNKKMKIEEEEFNEKKDLDNFANLKKINSDYEKLYGRIYRILDLRSLKSRVWNNLKQIKEKTDKLSLNQEMPLKEKDLGSKHNIYNETELNKKEEKNLIIKEKVNDNQEDEITFKKLYEETIKSMNPEMKSTVNDSSLFVCVLHLANEKNLDLIQSDNNESDFKIKFNNPI